MLALQILVQHGDHADGEVAGFARKDECKWGKPAYTMDGENIVILQGFKEYFALGFFQGALLKDPKKLLVQLGQAAGKFFF